FPACCDGEIGQGHLHRLHHTDAGPGVLHPCHGCPCDSDDAHCVEYNRRNRCRQKLELQQIVVYRIRVRRQHQRCGGADCCHREHTCRRNTQAVCGGVDFIFAMVHLYSTDMDPAGGGHHVHRLEVLSAGGGIIREPP